MDRRDVPAFGMWYPIASALESPQDE